MAKRSWLEANDFPQVGATSPPAAATTSRRRGYDLLPESLPTETTSAESLTRSGTDAASHPHTATPLSEQQAQSLTSVEISRKVKACAACRKQKIRCHMVDGKPPCTRCKQRGLSCVLNKSLQMLMEEKSQWHQDIVKDLELLHRGLQETRQQLALVPLLQLRSSTDRRGSDTIDPGGPIVDDRESERHSPALTTFLGEDRPPTIRSEAVRDRIESPAFPYSFSTMQPHFGGASRHVSDPPEGIQSPSLTDGGPHDFIAAGQISESDAQRLFSLYVNVLDRFVDGIGGRWQTLEALRSRSPILTASLMAVAAIHDPQFDHLYQICNQELRRLVAASLFDHRVSRDYLRALCLASYWLSDASWTLIGVAIRRATEQNLASSYQRVITEGSEDAADCLRLWYHLHICDRNLATVFGREILVRDDPSVIGWNQFLKSPVARSQDKTLVMMLGLHLILGPVRDLFGADNGTPFPVEYSTQIAYYSQQLDHWLGVWLDVLREAASSGIASGDGELHLRSAMLQYLFARVYLCSHVFRGLSPTAPIPEPLRDAARIATSAAVDAIQLCLNNSDLVGALRGMPTHRHAMLCFACVFLLKVAVKRQDGLVDVNLVSDLAERLVRQLRGIQVSKWHPAKFAADMLERSAALYLSLGRTSSGKGKDRVGESTTRGLDDMMERASRRAHSLFPVASTSAIHQSVLDVDEEGGDGSGLPGLSSSFESPGLTFETPNFFDFGGAAQSGQEDDASGSGFS